MCFIGCKWTVQKRSEENFKTFFLAVVCLVAIILSKMLLRRVGREYVTFSLFYFSMFKRIAKSDIVSLLFVLLNVKFIRTFERRLAQNPPGLLCAECQQSILVITHHFYLHSWKSAPFEIASHLCRLSYLPCCANVMMVIRMLWKGLRNQCHFVHSSILLSAFCFDYLISQLYSFKSMGMNFGLKHRYNK